MDKMMDDVLPKRAIKQNLGEEEILGDLKDDDISTDTQKRL